MYHLYGHKIREWIITSLAGKELELVGEVECNQLDIVGLTSTHSLDSETQPLEKG